MEWFQVLKEVVLPIGAAVGTVVLAVIRFASRFSDLEKSVRAVDQRFESTQKAWKLDFDTFKGEISKEVNTLKYLLEQNENGLERLRDSSVDYAKDAELARFIEEQQRQWNQIQRALGQIEGALKGKT